MKLTGFNKVAAIEYCDNVYYYALYDDDIKIGDNVLVSGALSKRLSLTVKDILSVEEMRKLYTGEIYEEVKCKFDLSAYNQRVENREKASELRKKMDEEIEKMKEINRYEMYADRNPALKEMLEEYKRLGV